MTNNDDKKLSRLALIALVVGSMVGSGLFSLPAKFANATGVIGGLIAWSIAGTGMLMLAFVFQNLSARKPDLDSGIYAYAKSGFGDFSGFTSALGYWLGACLADVACLLLIIKAFGFFFPFFLDEDNNIFWITVAASVVLWAVHFLVLRGVKEAATLNTIATVAKILTIFVLIFFAIYGFNYDVFVANLWGNPHQVAVVNDAITPITETYKLNPVDDIPHESLSVFEQARNAMLLTVFVFVGIEGASVYSRYAKNRNDVGVATVLGFLGVLAILVLVTMLSFGVLPQAQLAALPAPSMAGVLESVVGPWGAAFVSASLLVAVLGNYLSWTLLAAEVLYSASKNQSMPKFLASENSKAVPSAALWASSLVIQLFVIVAAFADQAFSLAIKMTGVMTLVPYFFVAAFGTKLAWTKETYQATDPQRIKDLIPAVIASIYTVAMIYAGGQKYLLLSAILYVLGSFLYIMVQRENQRKLFTSYETIAFIVLIGLGLFGVYAIYQGIIIV